MRIVFRYLLILLTLATGALFLYSAWTKVLPIQPFEYTMVEFVHMPWRLATFAARFMVGIEAALGGLMVFHLFGKRKQVLKAALLLLIVFNIYLIWLWATAGDDINCGCFGDEIWMSPSVSLAKNAVLMFVIVLLLRFQSGFVFRRSNTLTAALAVIGIILPFILYPVSKSQPNWLRKDSYKLDLSPLYHPIRDTTITEPPAITYPMVPEIDLTKGKYVIAFLSPTCPHCKIAARKMSLIKKENPAIPFYIVIGGTSSDLTNFWKDTKAEHLPYSRLHREPFLEFTGGIFPLIVWVNNGTVEAKSTYNTMNKNEIEEWLQQANPHD